MFWSKVLLYRGILHNREMLTQSQLSGKFKGKLANVKNLIEALKALNIHAQGTEAIVHIGTNGLQLIVEDSNCFQAVLYVTDSAFTEFELDGTSEFKINLSVLCDCLGIFFCPGNCIRLTYKGRGSPLILIMEDTANNNCIIECSIKTQTESDPLHFDDVARLNQIVLRSGQFLEILGEVDKSCEEVQLTLSPKSPFFRVRTMGQIQSATEFEVDKISESIVSFNCKERSSFSYKMSQLRFLLRALPLSSRVALSTNINGLLTSQVILILEGSEPDGSMYVEYSILPLAEQTTPTPDSPSAVTTTDTSNSA